MGIATIIQIILMLIKYAPDIARLFREIVERIRKNRDKEMRKAHYSEVSLAFQEFRKHRDIDRFGDRLRRLAQRVQERETQA